MPWDSEFLKKDYLIYSLEDKTQAHYISFPFILKAKTDHRMKKDKTLTFIQELNFL